MLYSVEDLVSKYNSVSTMFLAVVQMDMTEIHFRINAE